MFSVIDKILTALSANIPQMDVTVISSAMYKVVMGAKCNTPNAWFVKEH